MIDLSSDQLRQAASIKEQLEKLQRELTTLLGATENKTPQRAGATMMSPEARARISAAMKARWAARNKTNAPKIATAPKTAAKPAKKVMSEATKAKLRAASKARWAKVKAGQGK